MNYVGHPIVIHAFRTRSWIDLRFSVQRKLGAEPQVYDARVSTNTFVGDPKAVTSMYRVTQEYGGRAVGSTHDKWTSVSLKHKHRGALDLIAAHLAHSDEVAAMLEAKEGA